MRSTLNTSLLDDRLRAIPPFPAVGLELLAMVGDDDLDIDSLVATVSKDPTLAARLLRHANSASLARPELAESVRDAARTLGVVGSLRYLTTDLSRATLGTGATGYGQDGRKLWQDAVVGARAAAEIASSADISTSVAYTAALMRDMGKLALAADVEEHRQRLLAHAEEASDFGAAEKAAFAMDHAEVGALLASRWRFPRHLVNAIRYHHRPSQAPADQALVSAVHVGDVVASLVGAGGFDSMMTPVDDAAFRLLGIDEEAVVDIVILAGQWIADLAASTEG